MSRVRHPQIQAVQILPHLQVIIADKVLLQRHPQGLSVGRFPFQIGGQFGQVGVGESPGVLGGPGLGEGGRRAPSLEMGGAASPAVG